VGVSALKDYNTVIIGAGPAGLSTGLFLKEEKISFIILDCGKPFLERDRTRPFELSHGVGGSGLFSDGKFSYPPSASGLWQEMSLEKAEKIYRRLENLFCRFNIALKPWDDVKARMFLPQSEVKEYDSQVFDFSDRKKILQYFCRELEDSIVTNTTVTSVCESRSGTFVVETDADEYYSCTTVVIATGKKSPLSLISSSIGVENHPIYEMGVRVECPQKYYRPANNAHADYKQIVQIDDSTQLRTFCSCKKGTVVQSSYDGVRMTYNGDSSNSQPYSNIGIMLRASSKESEYAHEMQAAYERGETFKIQLREYLSGTTIVGGAVDQQVIKYLPQILPVENENCLDNSYVYGPEIERYGDYLDTMQNRPKINGKNIYVCGDASGKYRGLFAAFFSGLCCADAIETAHQLWLNEKISEFHINTSETTKMKMAFTAQSKVFFYCRDVVCEYTLSQGFLPINPFRVFDYFLSDRVNRDLIRRGNNNLLQMCDELWVFGPISNGVLFEIASAIKQKKQVRFFSIGTRASNIHMLELEQISFEPEVHKKQIKKEDLIAFIRESGRGCFGGLDFHQISLFDGY